MKSRIILLFILLSVMWSALITRAAFLQVLPNARLEALRKRQFETVVTVSSRRGDVLDRKGQELAISATSHSLFVDPRDIEEPVKTAKFLATLLKLPYKTILEKVKRKKTRFVWISRHMTRDIRDKVTAKKIRGLGWIEESKRTYPNERLLSQVLGYVGGEGGGLEGLEAQYNKSLEAGKVAVNIQRDARGRPLMLGGQLFSEAPTGADLELTIDRDLQFVLEQELREAVSAHKADSAVGVILDAQTSEILAMANSPAFDPNAGGDYTPDKKRNRTVTDAFEPGSTMKTFIIAGALNKKIVEPNTRFNCEDGSFRIGNRIIREADSDHKFKILTVNEILMHSSNIGTTKIAQKMGSNEVYDALKLFGFGDKSGVDLPGEARGIVNKLPWREHLLANISFGHGVSTTPLQMANAYASIANGGWLKKPYIVRRIKNHETDTVTEIGPENIRRVMPDDVASKLRLILAQATGPEGTGGLARVAGFPVAGKTGTAQKVNPNGRGYLQGGYISSFAGFIPANDPKFVIYVAVDNPRKGYYGSQVAAPVFGRVASYAVRQAGLAPVLISEVDVAPKKSSVAMKSSPVKPANAVLPASFNPDTVATTVPNLEGLSLREVVRRMQGSGLQIQVKGQGLVRHFSPAEGTEVANAESLTVYLEPEAR